MIETRPDRRPTARVAKPNRIVLWLEEAAFIAAMMMAFLVGNIILMLLVVLIAGLIGKLVG